MHTTLWARIRLRTPGRGKGVGLFAAVGGRVVLAMLLAAALALPVRAVETGAVAECGAPGVSCGGEVWEYSAAAQPSRMIHVPLVRQGRANTCGVACVQSILRYAGYEFDVREELLLEPLRVDESGTPIAGMLEVLNRVRRPGDEAPVRAEARENMTLADLERSIDSGRPVICLIQAWQTNAGGNYELQYDYSREWEAGHYVIAVGYDWERIYFMDPSTMGAYTYIPRAELDARWHGAGEATADGFERLEHAGIVVTVTDPRYTPCGFYKML